MSTLPTPDQLDPDSRAHTDRATLAIRQAIRQAGGWLAFDHYMEQALYGPGIGYYAAGSRKLATGDDLARDSDFITAPQLTPLFAGTLAGPVAAVLQAANSTTVLEFGAGTGALAADLIDALLALGVDVQYQILEVSGDLRERQEERLRQYGERVHWLDGLPSSFAGCVIANEVLDAMPVRLFRWAGDGALLERGVAESPDGFDWADQPADPALAKIVAARMPPLPGYLSEINLRAEAFMREMGNWLQTGAALLIDYGFPRHEYYHPQRAEGTLMCHYRHTAHADPLVLPGLQDITAHIDFTAMADAAHDAGLDIYGFLSQARFLMNAGLTTQLQRLQQANPQAYAASGHSVNKLISEAEMGELFKVLAVGRGLTPPPGFEYGDRLHTL